MIEHLKLGPDPRWYRFISQNLLAASILFFIFAIVQATRILRSDAGIENLGVMTEFLLISIGIACGALLFGMVKSWGWLDPLRKPRFEAVPEPGWGARTTAKYRHLLDSDSPQELTLSKDRLTRTIKTSKKVMLGVYLIALLSIVMVLVTAQNGGNPILSIETFMVIGITVAYSVALRIWIHFRHLFLRKLIENLDNGDKLVIEQDEAILIQNGVEAERCKLTKTGDPIPSSQWKKSQINETWPFWQLAPL